MKLSHLLCLGVFTLALKASAQVAFQTEPQAQPISAAPSVSAAPAPVATVRMASDILELDNIGLGYQYASFDYREPGVMTQKGNLKGFLIEYTNYFNNQEYMFKLDFEAMSGSVDYQGGLSNFDSDEVTPYASKDNYNTSEFRPLLGWNVYNSIQDLATIYSGLAFRTLEDENDSSVYDYQREISQVYLPLGVELHRLVSDRIQLGALLEYDQLLSGTVNSRLSQPTRGSLPDLENKQRNGKGYRAGLMSRFKFKSFSLFVNGFYRNWDIADSEKQLVRVQDSILQFVEPKNKTEIMGLNLGILF